MKKRLFPIGYNYSASNIIGGLVCSLSPFLFLIIVNNIGNPIKISIWLIAAVPVILFGLIWTIVNLIRIKRIKELQKQRKMKMKQTPIQGTIEDIKRSRLDWQGRTTNVFEKGDKNVYQLVVSYYDPRDGQKKTALSECYYENLYTCLADNYVNVYKYNNNESVLIDGLHIRQISGTKIVVKNDENPLYNSDIHFYFDIYGDIIFPVLGVMGVVIAVVFFCFARGNL